MNVQNGGGGGIKKAGHVQYFRQGNNKDINCVNIISFFKAELPDI